MRRKLRKYVICGFAAVLLSAFPAQGVEDPDTPSVSAGAKTATSANAIDSNTAPDIHSQDAGPGGSKGTVPSNPAGGGENGGDSADIRDMMEKDKNSDGFLGVFSKEGLIQLAIGAAAGAAMAGTGIFLWFGFAGRKKERDQEEARRQAEERLRADQRREKSYEIRKRESASAEGTESFENTPFSSRMQAEAASGRQTRVSGGSPSTLLPDISMGTIGKVHHVGRRRNQQDTMGTASTRLGLLAVVSDGMGGLSDGEKVSQKAVQGMLEAAGRVAVSGNENPLFVMLSEANEQVLRMLGPDQVYKSGATLLAVLVNNSRFHWVAVGDSRIYLYCSGHLFQINREHIYKQQLIGEAVNKNISFSRVNTDPQRDRLISFLGMGELTWVDGSLRPVDVKQGDKLLLMSDGIFNTISESEIIRILETARNAAGAAELMEKQVLAAGNPKQDNFTCVILDF